MDSVRLKKDLAEAGLSQKQVFAEMGISRSTFVRKCRGLHPFTCKELELLMELIGERELLAVILGPCEPSAETDMFPPASRLAERDMRRDADRKGVSAA